MVYLSIFHMFQCFYKLFDCELCNLFFSYSTVCLLLLTLRSYLYIKRETSVPMIRIATIFPQFIFVSWLYSWYFVLLLLLAEVSFLFSYVVFSYVCLDFELLVKKDLPHFRFTNEFSHFFLLFLRLYFFQKKFDLELFLMFGVKYRFNISFYPRRVILQHHLLKNPSLPSHLL